MTLSLAVLRSSGGRIILPSLSFDERAAHHGQAGCANSCASSFEVGRLLGSQPSFAAPTSLHWTIRLSWYTAWVNFVASLLLLPSSSKQRPDLSQALCSFLSIQC